MSDRANADYQRGKSDGSLVFFLVISTVLTTCFGVFKKCGDEDRIEWFRKHTVKTGSYEPCKDPGADWAMGVDCSTWRGLRDARPDQNKPK